MPRIDLKPRKTPRQRRSAVTVQTLLEAATRVLERESLSGFNTNQVAAVAGFSVGTVYQYFPNKDAIVTALIDRAQAGLAQALQDAVDAAEGLPLADALRGLAQLAVRQQFARPLLAAALDHEEKRLPLAARLRTVEGRNVDSVATLLDRYRGSQVAADAVRVAARDCLVITKALVEADAGTARHAPAGLEDRIVRALLGYLSGPGGVVARPAMTARRASQAGHR